MTALPLHSLLRGWVFFPLEISTVAPTCLQILDFGHGQRDDRWLEADHSDSDGIDRICGYSGLI